MKKLNQFAAVAFALAAFTTSALAGNCSSCDMGMEPKSDKTAQPAAGKVQYTCSMHPEVIADAPGNCPKCGMKLVEKKTDSTTPASSK